MFDAGTLTTMLSMIAAIVTLLLVQRLTVYRLRHDLAARDKRLQQMQGEIRALLACSRGVGEKLQKQQRQLRTLMQRQGQLEEQTGERSKFGAAAKLHDKGVAPDDLVNTYGLSPGEAQLVAHLRDLQNGTAA